MNEQQLQQILTIQQAIAAAATAAVINSLLNPQQAAAGLNNPTTANALTEALRNSQNQLDLQLQHQHQQPDSRQDSAIATSSSPAANNIPLNDINRLQELMLQLQQQAAVSGGTGLNTAAQQQQQQQQPVQAALAAALNLNLNNANNTNNLSLQQQLHNHLTGGSPLSQSPLGNRLQLSQTDLIQQLVTSAATGSNSISNQSSPNKKLKSRHIQQSVVLPFTPHTRPSSDATTKPQQHQSTPKSHHSNLAIGNRSNSNNNSSSSSSFLPNNVGLPRKLVRGQDVWLGRGAEQTRQILKCMWCGQSFRTLAEMTQHMRETQHYTNIISQEQITSWRQPDGSETGSSKQHSSKQSSHNARLSNDHLDDLSDRLNDSEDSFSNEDEPSPKQRSSKSKSQNKSPIIKHESVNADNNESMIAIQNVTTAKPVTRSRKRDHEDTSKPPNKREKLENEHSQTNTSPSQQRVLSDLNEDSEANKESKIDSDYQEENSSNNQISTRELDTDEERAESTTPSTKSENVKQEGNHDSEQVERDLSERLPIEEVEEEHENDADDDVSQDDAKESKNILDEDDVDENDEKNMKDPNHADNESYSDSSENKNRKRPGKKLQVDITSTSSAKSVMVEGQKVDASGDPLSALETMVEKSFDPRLRPGVASGGILQRLGIDEEVCPPWQHINYANWYAAAAYGHPMAAALLAAGINLQNGIKLGKNLSSKKSDDD